MSRAFSKSIIRMAMLAGASLLFAGRLPAQVALDDEFAKDPTWKAPSASDVRTSMMAWLDVRKPDEAIRKQAEALWPAPAGEPAAQAIAINIDSAELLERVVTTMSLADPDAKQLVDLCSKPHSTSPTPTFAWLTDEKTPTVVRNNLRLWLGKWLAQERLYDEAMAQLADLQPAEVVDPASLLFYQSVCHHWMLHKTDGLKTIARLLEQKKTIPRRYEQLAELMQNDLSELEDDSLDHISRRMNDVTRRLDFGHAGKKVRGVEDGIVASLDKLIKEMEDMANASQRNRQQRQQQAEGAKMATKTAMAKAAAATRGPTPTASGPAVRPPKAAWQRGAAPAK